MTIVAFSGVDGSGKSTQIELLRAALERAGRDPVVFWFRPGYSDLLNTLKGLVRRARPGALPTAEKKEARERAFSRPWVRWAWVGMALTDTVFHLGLWLRLQSVRGKVVLCDRYLFDALLDLELRFPESRHLCEALAPALRRLLPRPDLWVFLSVSSETMAARLAAKDEPFPDPEELRQARYKRYLQWAEGGEAELVDAEASVAQVHERILDLLAQRTGLVLEPVAEAAP